jgi:hypothetical protein
MSSSDEQAPIGRVSNRKKKSFHSNTQKNINVQNEEDEHESEIELPPANFMLPSDAIIMEQVTAQMAKVFERELRKTTEINIPLIEESDAREEIDENSRHLAANLLESSYFKLSETEGGAVIELDAQAFKAAHAILRDTNKYLEKESELTGIEKRVLAPRFNVPNKRDKVLTNRKDKAKEEAYENELATLDQEATKKKQKRDTLKGWFDMEAPVMTPELHQDLVALRLKHATEGSAKNRRTVGDVKHLPKYFQIGKIVEDATEYYSSRVPKRQREQSILDEMVSEDKRGGYVSGRYKEIQEGLNNVQSRKKKRMEKQRSK